MAMVEYMERYGHFTPTSLVVVLTFLPLPINSPRWVYRSVIKKMASMMTLSSLTLPRHLKIWIKWFATEAEKARHYWKPRMTDPQLPDTPCPDNYRKQITFRTSWAEVKSKSTTTTRISAWPTAIPYSNWGYRSRCTLGFHVRFCEWHKDWQPNRIVDDVIATQEDIDCV